MYKRSSKTNSGGSTKLEPPQLSRSPFEFKSASAGKIEEEVLVIDGIIVKTPPVAKVKSLSSMGSGQTLSSSGKKNYREISLSDRKNSGGLKCQEDYTTRATMAGKELVQLLKQVQDSVPQIVQKLMPITITIKLLQAVYDDVCAVSTEEMSSLARDGRLELEEGRKKEYTGCYTRNKEASGTYGDGRKSGTRTFASLFTPSNITGSVGVSSSSSPSLGNLNSQSGSLNNAKVVSTPKIESITLLSWNINGFPDEIRDRMNGIWEIIKRRKPDIICFQEFTPEAKAELDRCGLFKKYDMETTSNGQYDTYLPPVVLIKKGFGEAPKLMLELLKQRKPRVLFSYLQITVNKKKSIGSFDPPESGFRG